MVEQDSLQLDKHDDCTGPNEDNFQHFPTTETEIVVNTSFPCVIDDFQEIVYAPRAIKPYQVRKEED